MTENVTDKRDPVIEKVEEKDRKLNRIDDPN